MKNRLILLTSFIMIAVAVSSCSKDDGSPADPSQTQDNVESGTWRVTLIMIPVRTGQAISTDSVLPLMQTDH